MRWTWLLLITACGSSEPAQAPSAPSAPSMAATMAATAESGMQMEAESTPEERTPPSRRTEPSEVPEELRESHDRLVARIDADRNDVSSICALASVLRRAEMYVAADERLEDAFRLAEDSTLDLELPEGAIEACEYERGRVSEAQGDWASARDSYWRATATPIERRRRIVLEAFFRAAKAELEESSCGAMSKIGLRSLLSLKDDLVFRRCLREREQDEPTCEIVRLDDARHPGTRAENYDAFATVGEDGAAFGLIGDELYVISVIRGRKQVRLCEFDVPDQSRLVFPRVLSLGDSALFYVSTTNVTSYTCECEEGEEGYPGSPGDCRCEDMFDIRFLFTDRGELRLALIDAYSSEAGMASVSWDVPHVREEIAAGPSVDGDVLRMGRRLRMRSHVLVPVD